MNSHKSFIKRVISNEVQQTLNVLSSLLSFNKFYSFKEIFSWNMIASFIGFPIQAMHWNKDANDNRMK